ncbi:FAD-dependent oxidoreductase [Aphanothece sacrum]|uniref:Amine oxidase n=1 Tax=Aphanothece sacrum FPU1 TaxID=1920663 RepID=A0A401IKA5_APHSA|nr:FAD-dependent oxidoreductase [Aphanothece sacrum]GBF81551.1 amine oxidase [Aphanothece sacrum FPU1]GBF86992.1 amine oxidase [Aphanothece sacrum FPU3]
MNQLLNLSTLSIVSRRTALKILGLSTLGGMVGYSRCSKPQPSIYQQDSLSLPYKLSKSKSVVVIGAGLAGLACAYELSQRGFQVTLLEKSPNLGGKIASWTINMGNETFKMEHGFHGFFPQYYNLKSIVQELDITNNFKSLNFYSVVFREGNYQPEKFYPSHSAFPWNIIDLTFWSPNRLKWGINLINLSHWQVFQAISGFKIPKSFAQLDSISVIEWHKKGFPQGLYDLYFLPFARSTLNAPDTLSAGELLQFFHFYFFGNPEGLAFNGTKDDMGTSLVNPISEAIKRNQGQIISEAIVSQINCQQGKITSLSYQVGTAQNNVPFWIEKNTFLSDNKIEYYGGSDGVFISDSESQEAISLTCTHQGCTVGRQTDGTFLCPCHGALYDAQGKVIKGPAKQDLPHYKIQQRNNESVQLVGVSPNSPDNTQTIEADYYIIATDVPGIKQLGRLIKGEINVKMTEQIEELAIADPFAVARFWFDRDFEWKYSDFTSLSGYKLTDSITLYHHIQTQFIEWAKRTGGSVVELHAYCYKEIKFPTQEMLLNTFEQELYEIVPELTQTNLLHRELVNQKNFSGYPPNSYNNRPETNTEIDNLLLAGDWVKMPFPCGLMERAVSSGLLAANQILQQEGLQRRELLTVNPEGLLNI